jgi:ABC-type Fe3+ transport system permease subunit
MAARDGDIDGMVRLYYRRRMWVAVWLPSLLGLFVCVLLDSLFSQDLAGSARTFSFIPLFVLLALAVAALFMALAYTVRLRSHGRDYKKEVEAHVSRQPVRDPLDGGLFGVVLAFAMLCCLFSAVPFLPQEVNSVSYLAGAEQQVTFHPVSHTQSCAARAGCSTVTIGFLTSSAADVTWPRDVPLGEDFPVRAPLWNWGAGQRLITSTVGAIGWLLLGLLVNGLALLILWRGFSGLRGKANQGQSPETVTLAGSYPD